MSAKTGGKTLSQPSTNKNCGESPLVNLRSFVMLILGRRHFVQPHRGTVISHVPPAKRHPYDQWSPDARALDLVGDKWTLLIVRDLLSGPRRFVELQRVLPGISTEQLRSRLNRMVADGMLTRKRYREVPPRVDYELTERSRELAPVLGQLARWGYEWAWGSPRSSERVDLGAIFRLIPGLVEADGAVAGTLEFSVTDDHGGTGATYRVTVGHEGAEITEGGEGPSDAQVRGSTAAWIEAFSPMGHRGGLAISGNEQFAGMLLDRIALGHDAHAAVADVESATA
jgi:DNA-binding HxlR family transcriptional regulator